jgi:hypothetical protein
VVCRSCRAENAERFFVVLLRDVLRPGTKGLLARDSLVEGVAN